MAKRGGRKNKKSKRGSTALVRYVPPPAPRQSPTVVVVSSPKKTRSASKKGPRTMAKRGKKGGTSHTGPAKLKTGEAVVVEVASEVMTGMAGLANAALAAYSRSTASTADDVAFPAIGKITATIGRAASRFILRKRHPALADVLESGFDAYSGAVYTRFFDAKGEVTATNFKSRSSGGG